MNLKAIQKINYGMFIVSSHKDGALDGQIANTVFQVTAEPVKIAVCINKSNLSYEYINASKVFSVSVLSESASLEFIGRFGFRSGRTFNKFENIRSMAGVTGSPIVTENCIAYYEAKVVTTCDVGSHVLFIGEVVAAEILDDNASAMTYAYYHSVKHGTAPKSAPTYFKEEKGDR